MQLKLGLVSALVLASCAPSQPRETPEPIAAPRAAPVPSAPAATPAAAPVLIPVTGSTVPDTAPPLAAVAPADSVALARQARDSILDASMLDALATAHPPETTPHDELDPATLRSMFDIDVANWIDHGRVRYYLDFFTGPIRERVGIWLERMPRYEPAIRSQLIAHGLPGDLAFLPLIESGYSPTAVSRAKAVGMWQFIKGTGRLYGLQIDSWVDERRDVSKATDAAIRFLADLTARFGSPYLAAAAYNGGPGRIERGLARIEGYDPAASEDIPDPADGSPQAGDAAFFQLAGTRHLRVETKDYVPKLIAAALIAKQPERYGFPPVSKAPVPPMDSVVVNDATGLDVIARLAGLSLADVWSDNPMYLRAVTPPKRRAVVSVPAGQGAATQLALDALPASERLTSFPHHARAGETLGRLAARYGLTLSELRGLNPEFSRRAPRAGEVVRIPGRARLSGWVAENRRVLPEVERRRSGGVHRVEQGETLSHLSARYGVSVAKLQAWNGLSDNAVLRVGQVIRIRPAASAPPRPSRPAPSRATTGPKRVHVVQAGETLTSLARRYRVSVQALREANSIPAGRPLLAGQRLTIPS